MDFVHGSLQEIKCLLGGGASGTFLPPRFEEPPSRKRTWPLARSFTWSKLLRNFRPPIISYGPRPLLTRECGFATLPPLEGCFPILLRKITWCNGRLSLKANQAIETIFNWGDQQNSTFIWKGLSVQTVSKHRWTLKNNRCAVANRWLAPPDYQQHTSCLPVFFNALKLDFNLKEQRAVAIQPKWELQIMQHWCVPPILLSCKQLW